MATPRRQPFHRAGAIDFNARYAVEVGNSLSLPGQTAGKRIYEPDQATDQQLSILVGDPLYTSKRCRLNDKSAICVMASLNGMSFTASQKAELDPILGQINMHSNGNGKNVAYLHAIDALRDHFFSRLSYTGFALDVWDHAVVEQPPGLAITRGGLMTIECDGIIETGDIVIVDMPWTDAHNKGQYPTALQTNSGLNRAAHSATGFTKCTRPHNKQTLVVVALPRRPDWITDHAELQEWRKYQAGFRDRGQVIGKCTRGNCKGKGNIDVILGTFCGGI